MRLIDADKLKPKFRGTFKKEIHKIIDKMPTVEERNDCFGTWLINSDNGSVRCNKCTAEFQISSSSTTETIEKSLSKIFLYCPTCGIRMMNREVIK